MVAPGWGAALLTRQIIRIEDCPPDARGPRIKVTFRDQFGNEREEELTDPEAIREAINEARRS